MTSEGSGVAAALPGRAGEISRGAGLRVGFVLDYIPDPKLASKEAILSRDSYTDRWLGSLFRAGVKGTKYVPSREVKRTETYSHRFGHEVKLVPVTHRLVPFRTSSTRQAMVGATSPLYRLEMLAFTLNLVSELGRDRKQIVHYANYFTTMFLFSPLVSLGRPVVTWFTGGDVPGSRLRMWAWFFALRPALSRVSCVLIGDYPDRRRVLLWLLKGDSSKAKPFQLLRVDRGLFAPADKAAARRKLGYDPKGVHIVSVLSIIPLPHRDPDMRQPYAMIEILAEASRALGADTPVSITVIGTGPGLEQLRALATELGLEGRVRFAGRVEHDRLPEYYAASDLVFVPYRMEALNETNVLAEAFSCARPVLAYRRRRELPLRQQGGFLIDPEPRNGGEELASVLVQPRLLADKASEAYSLSAQFDLGTAASDLVSAYLEVLNGRPGRARV